jgi:flagellar motor switch/type III secretory pathway protein FliN
VTVGAPNFSLFPFGSLPRHSRADAALLSAIARWLVPRSAPTRALPSLLGAEPTLRLESIVMTAVDPYAARVEVRAHGASAVVSGPSQFVKDVAQRLLGGPAELPASRPLTAAERGVWAVLVSAALTDAGLPGEVWPVEHRPGLASTASPTVELTATVGTRVVPIWIELPSVLATRVPPPRRWPAWTFDVPVVVGACTLPHAAVARLRARDVVVIERQLALVSGDGTIELTASTGAVEAKVASGYNRRAMSTPTADAAELELTVQLGTTRLSLRQLADLAPGAVVPLGRPLAGPFEVRAAGRLIGEGELVDVDGELGVRIVSLQE